MTQMEALGIIRLGDHAPCECARLFEQYRRAESTYKGDFADLAMSTVMFCARKMYAGRSNYVITYTDEKTGAEYRAFVARATDHNHAVAIAKRQIQFVGHEAVIHTVRAVRDPREWDELRGKEGQT